MLNCVDLGVIGAIVYMILPQIAIILTNSFLEIRENDVICGKIRKNDLIQ
jgi:hypothetical protein